MRRFVSLAAVGVLTAAILPVVSSHADSADDPAKVGSFSQPFQEPQPQPGQNCVQDQNGRTRCLPAAMAVAALPNGKVLYWDGLEGTEDIQHSAVAEYGVRAQDDASRVLDLTGAQPSWDTPTPYDGGANPGGGDFEYLPIVPHNNDDTTNDGDMFCADLVFLANGMVLTNGGTGWYLEPGTPGLDYGVSELEGLKNTRVFNPATNQWAQTGSMKYGRWYPSMITLGDGRVLTLSGVTKLIKPLYASHPTDSGRNVVQPEIYDPNTGQWSTLPDSANYSLPLFPRVHLLPDGHVYYDAAGQTYNPQGQSYDEATWNFAAVFDPSSSTWKQVGVPMIGALPLGFRGSAMDQMLTLKPPYDKVQILSAGGVIGVTPGTYFATDTSTLDTIDTTNGDALTSEATAPLNNRRWYSAGVTLPTGQVFLVNGTTADEVVGPGSSFYVTQSEMFDPETKTWTPMATEHHGRAYHNSAVLLPDGTVLVGGHAPIATGYAAPNDTASKTVGTTSPWRDPTFEIYQPPYLHWGYARPTFVPVDTSLDYGKDFAIDTTDANDIASVVLVRNTAYTHLIDGDQRVVELPIASRSDDTLHVSMPTNRNVLPPGPYMLFINKSTPKGLVPSVSEQLFVGAPAPGYLSKVIASSAGHAVPSAVRGPKLPATGGNLLYATGGLIAVSLALGWRRRRRTT